VKRVLAMTGSTSAIVNRPLPTDDPRRRRPDITRATKLLGWAPRTTLEVGLKATIAWFSEERQRERDRGALRVTSNLAKAAAV
jgi:UDP-glucuronate decarboxylase